MADLSQIFRVHVVSGDGILNLREQEFVVSVVLEALADDAMEFAIGHFLYKPRRNFIIELNRM